MFERETRREKFIEAKIRENKTKMNSKLPNKVDNFNEKAELLIKESEREITEVVDRMVSYCDFIFFNNQIHIYIHTSYRVNIIVWMTLYLDDRYLLEYIIC